jgi:uncharacterized protein (UPF0216 family)
MANAKVEAEIKRLQEMIRNARAIIDAQDGNSDPAIRREVERQRQYIKGWEAEIASLSSGGNRP